MNSGFPPGGRKAHRCVGKLATMWIIDVKMSTWINADLINYAPALLTIFKVLLLNDFKALGRVIRK